MYQPPGHPFYKIKIVHWWAVTSKAIKNQFFQMKLHSQHYVNFTLRPFSPGTDMKKWWLLHALLTLREVFGEAFTDSILYVYRISCLIFTCRHA